MYNFQKKHTYTRLACLLARDHGTWKISGSEMEWQSRKTEMETIMPKHLFVNTPTTLFRILFVIHAQSHWDRTEQNEKYQTYWLKV